MFKKYIFLLILSFFSIQGFAAGCPDGSEPVKSISADGTYFEFKCNIYKYLRADNKSPNFQIINLTELDDNYFIDKANYASSQMTNVITQTLALIYPVGTFIDYKINPNNEVDFLGTVKVSHEIVLKDWQIEEALDKARKFFASQDCLNNLSYMSMLDDINWVLANGYASGLQAVMCDDVRFIMMSIDPWEREKKSKNLIRVFFHEIYHSLQNDLQNTCSNFNDIWIVEAATEYFAQHATATYNNSSKNYVNNILEIALRESKNEGYKLEDPAIAEKGMGALRLMVELGWVEESHILNGSLFHDNCSLAQQFSNDNPEIKYIKDNWFKIEIQDGNYKFNPSIINEELEEEIAVFYSQLEEEISKINPQPKEEICQGHIQANWPGYIDINKNEFNSKGFMFVVSGEGGRCNLGIGPSSLAAYDDCTKNQERNNIVGTCELYAKGEEVVWGSSESNQKSTLDTTESEDYVEKLKQIRSLLDTGIINKEDFEKMKQKIIDTIN